MADIKINELATQGITLSDWMIKSDANGLMSKNSVQSLADILGTSGEVAFNGSLSILDVPEDGWYFASESGTYTNANDLVVNLNNQMVIVVVSENETVFSQIEIGIGFTEADPSDQLEGSTKFSNDGQIYDKVKSELIGVVEKDSTIAAQSGDVYDFTLEQNKSNLKSQLNGIEGNFNSVFNGTTSIANLESDITLENEGDSIEITLVPTNLAKGLGAIGEFGTQNSTIGFNASGNLYVRSFDSTWLTLNGFSYVPSVNEVVKLKLVWTSDAIKSYSDGVFQKNITKGKLILSNIGDSYNFFEGKIRDIKILSNYIETNIPSPYFLDDSTDITLESTEDGYLTESQREDIDDAAQTATDLQTLKDVQKSITQFYPFTDFNGSTSNFEFNQQYTLENDGDYLEATVRLDDLGDATNPYGMGIFGEAGNYWNIGVWFNGELYIRENTNNVNSWLTMEGFNAPLVVGEVFTFKILLDTGNSLLKIYKNDVLQKDISYTGVFSFIDVGNAYNNGGGVRFKGGLRGISFRASSIDTVIPDLTKYVEGVGNDLTEEVQTTNLSPSEIEKLNESASLIDYAETYYELDVTGSNTGDELFTVYQKIKDNSYAGFEINHVVDAAIQSDLWRIVYCYEYIFDGVSMNPTSNKLLTGGESEFVYRTKDGAGDPSGDFTGGVHGDEIQISANFYASGVVISDISENIPLTPCNNFYYTNQSHTKTYGTTDNESLHDKLTFIENSGYRTVNRLTWLITPIFDLWYHGISCVGKACGTVIHNELLESDTFTAADNTFKLENTQAREYYSTNNTTNLSAYVWSKITNNEALDGGGYMRVWDRSLAAGGDNKYYREVNSGDVTPVSGDVWVSEMIVKFNKQ